MQTSEWTKAHFHFRFPLLKKNNQRLSAYNDMFLKVDGYLRYYKSTIEIDEEQYFLCKEWFESNRKYLIAWLKKMGISYDDLREICSTDHCQYTVKEINQEIERISTANNFEKNVDWSFLTMGVTIPVKFHNVFLENLTVSPLPLGKCHPVVIRLGEREFKANILSPNFSDATKKQVIQILWSKNAPIAKFLQHAYMELYQALSIDKKNRALSTHCCNVKITNRKDYFEFDLDVEIPEFDEVKADCAENPMCNMEFSEVENLDAVTVFEKDIITHYSNGFDFSDNAMRLVSKRLGIEFSSAIQTTLKKQMFKRHDGCWFFPDSVMSIATQVRYVDMARKLLQSHGFLSLQILHNVFEPELHHVDALRERHDFAEFLLVRELSATLQFTGASSKRICTLGGVDLETMQQNTAAIIQLQLKKAYDAVRISTILEVFPNLNDSCILTICEDYLPEAIVEDIDGVLALKILDAYYLPMDFAVAIADVIAVSQKTQLSLAILKDLLSKRYNCLFDEDYALTNDAAFKQIISLFYNRSNADNPREWHGKFFVGSKNKNTTDDKTHKSSLIGEFLEINAGIFHENDFFYFARNVHGYKTNNDLLVLTYIRPNCIRLDESNWMSPITFRTRTSWSNNKAQIVTKCLLERLGNSAFLSLGLLSHHFFDSLPEISFEGRNLSWNHHLLTSVACICLDELNIINNDAAPYTVTAMLIPPTAKAAEGAVAYAIDDLKASRRHTTSVEDVFTYLKERKIRMRLSKSLEKTIQIRMGWK